MYVLPFTTKVVTVTASKLASVSLLTRLLASLSATTKVTSSSVVFVSGFATGENADCGTVTVTVAVSVPPLPSDIW